MLDKLLSKADSLFGNNESLEDIILSDEFNEKKLDRKLSSYELNLDNLYLLKLAIKNNKSEPLKYLIENVGFNINVVDKNEENILFLALEKKSKECSEILIQNEISLTQVNKNGISVLHMAAQSGLLDIFNTVAKKNQDLEIEDKNGRNILFYAIKSKNFHIIKRVFELTSIKLNSTDKNRNTIAHLKEITANIDLLKFFIKKGLKIDALNNNKEDFFYLNCLDLDIPNDFFEELFQKKDISNRKYSKEQETILIKLVKKLLTIDIQVFENKTLANKYQERFLNFINSGLDVNSTNKNDENLLFYVVRANNNFVLEFCLDKTNVQINQLDKNRNGLLQLAIFRKDPDMDLIKNLIYHDVDCMENDSNGYSVIDKIIDVILSRDTPLRENKILGLQYAKSLNLTKLLIFILDYKKIKIDDLNFGNTPMVFEVAKSFNVQLLEVLKRYGANLDIKDSKTGLNVYYEVLEAGKKAPNELKTLFLKTLKYLVFSEVNLSVRDSYGGDVIHKAVLDHDLKVFNLLTQRIDNFKSKDKKGRTYIHNAVWNNKVEILKKLAFIEKDLINEPDKFGLLPINYGVILGKKEAVLALIQMGAFLNNPNKVSEDYKYKFFAKLGKLGDLLNQKMTSSEKETLTKLVKNMQEELQVE
ncbi:MAG: ankyrin repeat domain-containing protein [Campylobacterota bacterium]